MLIHSTLGEMDLSLNNVISPDGAEAFYTVVKSFIVVNCPQN